LAKLYVNQQAVKETQQTTVNSDSTTASSSSVKMKTCTTEYRSSRFWLLT